MFTYCEKHPRISEMDGIENFLTFFGQWHSQEKSYNFADGGVESKILKTQCMFCYWISQVY